MGISGAWCDSYILTSQQKHFFFKDVGMKCQRASKQGVGLKCPSAIKDDACTLAATQNHQRSARDLIKCETHECETHEEHVLKFYSQRITWEVSKSAPIYKYILFLL